MRKTILKSLLTIACLLCSITLYAHDFEVDGIYYYITSETDQIVEVVNRIKIEYTGNVVIPETVTYCGTTYSVTSIGDYAFYKCRGLTSVTIGNSVTSIGDYAFEGCTGLTEVTIPESVILVGYQAFYDTPFYNNQPDGVVYLGKVLYAYKGTMPKNTSINIKEGTISITHKAFNYFENCTGLKSITIPESVTYIGDYAFGNCTGLTTVNFYAKNCSIMGSDDYPVFSGCTNLTTLNIGENVENIPRYAFTNCTGLTSVTIPNSVTSIGGCAFYGCSGLTSITIPNSVTSIPNHAFYGCTSLSEIAIPNSVTSIGDFAFAGCDRIKTVNCYAQVPPTIYSHTFTVYVNDNANLHVVNGSKDAYADAKYWEYFMNITDDLTAGVEDITCDNVNAPIEYYDLNGWRVEKPTRGIYIVKQGSTVKKVVLKN